MWRSSLKFREGLKLVVMLRSARETRNVSERVVFIVEVRGIYFDLHYGNQLITGLTNSAQIPTASLYLAAL
jgi:hypothetical protein